MKAVIIKGNPKFINTPEAKKYYSDIYKYLAVRGVKVTFDAGDDYTQPPWADFYIGHSRGEGRERFLKQPVIKGRFLRFGCPGGINHPVDDKWFKEKTFEQQQAEGPHPEHFIFTDGQKQAIDELLRSISSKTMSWSK